MIFELFNSVFLVTVFKVKLVLVLSMVIHKFYSQATVRLLNLICLLQSY